MGDDPRKKRLKVIGRSSLWLIPAVLVENQVLRGGCDDGIDKAARQGHFFCQRGSCGKQTIRHNTRTGTASLGRTEPEHKSPRCPKGWVETPTSSYSRRSRVSHARRRVLVIGNPPGSSAPCRNLHFADASLSRKPTMCIQGAYLTQSRINDAWLSRNIQ